MPVLGRSIQMTRPPSVSQPRALITQVNSGANHRAVTDLDRKPATGPRDGKARSTVRLLTVAGSRQTAAL